MVLVLEGLLILAMLVVPGVIGALVVRRLSPATFRHHNREAADPVWAIAGGAFGLLLGFMVVVMWEDLQSAQKIVQDEASDIFTLHQLTFGLPAAADPPRLREQIRQYTNVVIEDEWPALGRHESSPEAERALDRIWHDYMGLGMTIGYSNGAYIESVDHLIELQDARSRRINAAKNLVPAPLWAVLIGGVVVVISMAWFTGSDDLSTHLLTTAVLALSLGSILFLIRVFNNPFQGEVRADPEPMERALVEMRER